MNNNNKYLRRLAIPYVIWMAILIVLPLFLIFWYSIVPQNTNQSLVSTLRFTLEHYKEVFSESYFIMIYYNSFKLAFFATLFSLLLGYPIALYFANMKSKTLRNILLLLLIIPMWTNMLLRTYAWTYLIETNGLINIMINKLNGFLPFSLPTLKIMNTQTAIVLGMVYNYIPFMILPIYAVLVKLDKDLLNAAYDLGANKWQGFLKITLPLSISGIVSGIMMVFLPAATSFIIPAYLGGNKINLIGSVIESHFKGMANNPNLGSALSVILMLIIFALTGLSSSQDREGKGESLW